LYESGLISTQNVISNFTSLKKINSSIDQIKKNKILGKCIINF
jgi:Zn-dependent alcohol dehydrogenase